MSEGAYRDEHDDYLDRKVEVKWYWGRVLDNEDVDKLGRVRVYVPGKTTDKTPWAWPVGMLGAGFARQGAYSVPRKQAIVIVGFIQGDFDEPVYMAGPWSLDRADGSSKVPRKVQEKNYRDAPNVRVLAETEKFEIYICDTEDEQRLVLATLDSTQGGTISINLQDGSIRLQASHHLILRAPMIEITASGQLQLQGREVGRLGNKI